MTRWQATSRIEASRDSTRLAFWEQRGYDNDAWVGASN